MLLPKIELLAEFAFEPKTRGRKIASGCDVQPACLEERGLIEGAPLGP